VVVFIAVMLAPAAIKGELNAASIKRLVGIKEPAPPPDPNANLGPLAQQLKAQQEKLATWQRELDEREQRLDEREQLVDQTLAEITKTKDEVMAAIEQLDEAQLASLTDIAKTMEKMTADKAAKDLEAMTPKDAARLLPLIKTSSRGEILDAVTDDKRIAILEEMQAKKY